MWDKELQFQQMLIMGLGQWTLDHGVSQKEFFMFIVHIF